MSGLWQRFRGLPLWGQWTIGIVAALLLIAPLLPAEEDGDDQAATMTAPEPAPAATTITTTTIPDEPTETLADAQEAVENNKYAKAMAIAAALGEEEVIRRRIANQIARRVRAAVSEGNRSRASFLLQQAKNYPSTSAVMQARSSYEAAKQRAADRKAAAEQAAAAKQAKEEAAAVAPEPESSGDGCDPNYSGCVPAYPPDVNCPDVDGPVQVTGSDPHGLDREGDGVACE